MSGQETRELRVVVVDDDPPVADLHTRFVAALPGWQVVAVAGTGPDAVAAIARTQPDVVLLDVHLPGFSGLEVLRTVRATRQRQPEVVAVTAARDVDSVREARLSGVRHYLVKPFSAADLHARLRDIGAELGGVRLQADGTTPTETPLEQHQIDALMAPSTGAVSLPKGLSAETLDQVSAALAGLPDATATDISERVGLSRVSCRRYLEHLADDGRAERSLDYTTTGRPSVRYRVTGRSTR